MRESSHDPAFEDDRNPYGFESDLIEQLRRFLDRYEAARFRPKPHRPPSQLNGHVPRKLDWND